MPDYTDPYLIPFPTPEEYGDGANGLEEAALVVDTLYAQQAARLTTLSTRPTVIRRRAVDQAWVAGSGTVTWDTVDHNNFSAVNFVTPAVGAHPVAGVYPALWRFDFWIHYIGTGPTTGGQYDAEVELRQALPGETFVGITRSWDFYARESGTGGEYLKGNGAMLLASPGELQLELFFGHNGNVKAGSWMSLTRIRSV